MEVIINENSKEFHLTNSKISYIFKVLENGQLGHLYYGSRINHKKDFSNMLQIGMEENVRSPYVFDDNKGFSLGLIKQEYPSFGTGDYKEPAITILQENGSHITNFTYDSYEITAGKQATPGLPGTYSEEDEEAVTLNIYLTDRLIDVELILSYTIFRKYAAIIRKAKVINKSENKVIVDRLHSASLDFNDTGYKIMHLSGAWARERHIEELDITQSTIVIDSKRGTSSSNNNPFIVLKEKTTTEYCGEAYGFSLVYSGNFAAQIEKNMMGIIRVNMGINPFNFAWTLEKNEAFDSPEIVIAYSDTGLNTMSQTYHNLYRNRLARGKWRDKNRPVVINNWEATYFDFDEKIILEIARQSKELGVELFVLDDGWFGSRSCDKQGLGDWQVNPDKLPSGITGLADKVEDIGMKFGLWFEPEMVNKDSDLYRAHPEWILNAPGRVRTECRNQFVLDLGREDVQEYLYKSLADILSTAKISYIKWDMNRPLTEVYSGVLPAQRQAETSHRYVLGLYKLIDRITTDFPDILFESCASGGSRFDPGMLYYMPQAWTSDNTDAVERLNIQYGTSLAYPVSSMGAHVSACPNHQAGRITPLQTRGNVAFFGAFGYELDLSKMPEEEKEIVREQVKFFKDNRETIQFGDFYRLQSPFEGDRQKASWITINQDKTKAVLGVYYILNTPNPDFNRLRLKGLDPDTLYKISNECVQGEFYYGDELMNSGIMFSRITPESGLDSTTGDFQSHIIVLEKSK